MDPSAADPVAPPAPVATPELIQALHAEFSAIKAELAELKRVRALERDRDFDDAENMSDEAVPTWGDILPKRQKEATEHNALALARLFAQPPPQDSVTEVCKDLPHYSGVPEAPQPKDNKYDKKHFVAQQKLQHCHCMYEPFGSHRRKPKILDTSLLLLPFSGQAMRTSENKGDREQQAKQRGN